MAGYVSNRFDNNPKAKDLALRINRLGLVRYGIITITSISYFKGYTTKDFLIIIET